MWMNVRSSEVCVLTERAGTPSEASSAAATTVSRSPWRRETAQVCDSPENVNSDTIIMHKYCSHRLCRSCRYRRVHHLSRPVRSRHLRQHARQFRVWMFRWLRERLHDDEELHGWDARSHILPLDIFSNLRSVIVSLSLFQTSMSVSETPCCVAGARVWTRRAVMSATAPRDISLQRDLCVKVKSVTFESSRIK